MATFEEIKLKISPGDVIKSKSGILSQSPLTGKFYIWHEATYKGGGMWLTNDKEEVDCEQVGKS